MNENSTIITPLPSSNGLHYCQDFSNSGILNGSIVWDQLSNMENITFHCLNRTATFFIGKNKFQILFKLTNICTLNFFKEA